MTELRQRRPRVECPEYLAWLRRQGCACGCGFPAPSDAAHIRAGSIRYGKNYTGMQQKPDDRWALPLRHDHHMAQHQHGDEVGWWSAHGMDPFELAIGYYSEYEQQHQKPVKPRLARKPNRKAKIPSRKFPKGWSFR